MGVYSNQCVVIVHSVPVCTIKNAPEKTLENQWFRGFQGIITRTGKDLKA
jgi:hypothetical protein